MPNMKEFCSVVQESISYSNILPEVKITMLLLCDRALKIEKCENILFLCDYKEALCIIDRIPSNTMLNLLISDTEGHQDEYKNLARPNLNYAVSNKQLVGLNNTLTKVFFQYNKFKKELDIVLANQGGLEPLIKRAVNLMGENVSMYVLSNTFQVLAACVSPASSEFQGNKLNLNKDLNNEQMAFVMDCLSNNKSIKYNFDIIKDNDMVVGYLMMICNSETVIYDMFKYMLTRRIASVINKTYMIYSSEQKEMQKLLTEILLLPPTDTDSLNKRLRTLTHPVKSHIRFLVISKLSDDSTPIWTMCSKLESIFPKQNITVYDGYIVAIFSGNSFLFRPVINEEEFCNFLEQNNAIALFTPPSKQIKGLRTVYMQAKELLPNLPLMQGVNKKRYAFFEDVYQFYRVHLCISGLKQQYGHETVAYLLHPVAVELIRYDMNNNTDFFNFIVTFAKCDGNIGDASVELHMHRNSVYNKLKKMNDIFNVDFTDGRLQRDMIFAMNVMQYTNNDPLKIIKLE